MESFTNSCRLCLWKGDKMLPIFTSPDDDETASKIRKCLPLDVRWEDNLPKGICASCLYKVEMLYEFHCSSVRVDSLLRKYLASENKDFAVKEQQLSSSGYQAVGVNTMRSVAIGTEDEYVPSTRIRECRESSGDRDSMVSRVRVRTPFDMNEMNSVGTSPTVQSPLRQSGLNCSDRCTSAVSSLAYRSDSAQGIDSASIHAVGVTEQSAANNTGLLLSGKNGTTYQEGDSGQPEPEAYMSSQGDPSETGRPKSAGETDIVCLSVKSSVNAMQNDLSTSRSCHCGDDDEVVVLAEYQKPPQAFRRSKTPIPFDSSSTSLSPSTFASSSTSTSALHGQKTQRLCARHQEYLRLMNLQQEKQRLQQQGLPRQETQQGTDQLPPRASEQTPAANKSSTGPISRDAARQVHYDTTQQAAKDPSAGGGTIHLFAKTPSNSTQPEEHVQPHAQSGPTCGATSSTVRRASSELANNTNRPSHLEHHVASAKHEGATIETVSAPLSSSAECNSSVSETRDQPRQAIPVRPRGTAVESSRTKPCGSASSSADSLPPSAAAASVPPPVPAASPATAPIPVPPSSAALPKTSASTSSTLPPETPVTTESAAPPIVTEPVTQSTVTANSGRTATHSPSAARSPSSGETPSTSTAQKRSATRSRSRTNSKSPSGRRGRSSKSPVSTVTSRPTPPPTPSVPSATQAPLPRVPLTTTITWPLSSVPTSSPSLLCISPQPQQQETGQQRVVLSARSSAQPEHQVIQGKLQDGLFKFPAFLVVTNASFHQPEQQGNVSPGLHSISPRTAQFLPAATPQILKVPKEEEQKQQSKQTGSPGKAISQLIAASALISPPRGSAQPEQQDNKPGEVQRETSSPLAAMHSCAQPKQCDQKSQVQCEQEKNRQQTSCDKLSGKTGRQSTDTENKGCSSKTGQTLSGADQRLSAASQSSKRKREHRSHSVIADLLATPPKSTAASPTPEQPKKIKPKLYTTQSLTEKKLLKPPEPEASSGKSSTQITDKMKQMPQVAEKQQSGGTVEQHQTMKAPALQNSDVSQKWKKKKRRKKEKNMETASRLCSSQPQSVTAKYELSGGEVELAQVERWRTVQQDAVEHVRSAVRQTALLPLPPLSDDTTSAPLPSSAVKTPPPPVLTPQQPSEAPFPPGSASPPLPMLPPAVSAAPPTDSPQSAGPRPQCATPPSGEKSPPTPFLTPPDGDNQQRSRLQQPSKAAAETSERRLRTPSPVASTGSSDWPAVPRRSGTSPRRYYNRKRRHTEASGAGRSGTENVAVRTECETLAPPPRPGTTSPAQVPVPCPAEQQQSVPPVDTPQRSTEEAPLLPQRSARVFRYSCRYCRQRFRARILLSLHRVNGACELHRSHNYARSGDVGGSDHRRVTERELMLAAYVRLERLYACPRCSRVLSSENTLKWHLAVRHGRDNPRDTRSTMQSRWPTSTPTPTDVLPTLPLLLPPLTGKLTDSKDTVLEALGLTRKT